MTEEKITSKEKALELIIKFQENKQHALFTVEEILNTIYNEDFLGHLIDEIDAASYWNEVKNEINKY